MHRVDARMSGRVGAMKPLMLVSELEDYTISLANGVAAHVPVVLVVPRRRYDRLAAEFRPEVDLRLMDWPRHSGLSNPRFLVDLTRLIRNERPSVIHMLSNTTLWLNAAMPFWRGVPLVTTVHDVELHPGDVETATLPRWATDLAARQSDDIIVHGESLRDLAAARFKKRPERIHVLPHPAIVRYAESARRAGLARRPGSRPFTLLLFGRIFAYKGLTDLIRAEALLGGRLRDLRIVIAGRGDDPWAHRDLMGDPTRYETHSGFIEDDDVARLFLDADAVALPYVEASQSGVLNLAAAFGRPVIATDVGELGATVATHDLGLIVPPGDPGRLAAAIADLAGRPDLAARLGANALAWASGPNAPVAVGAKTVALYREIVGRMTASRRPAFPAAALTDEGDARPRHEANRW